MRWLAWPFVVLVTGSLGCTELLPGDRRNEGLDASAPTDASSRDAGRDAGFDAGGDAASPGDAGRIEDAGRAPDAGRDGGFVEDAGFDADVRVVDAGRDAGVDGGVDAGGGVVGLEVHHVAVGVRHTCAVVGPNRDVACWGHAGDGGAGVDPSTVTALVPPTLLPGRRGATSICAGNDFTCIARDDGTVRSVQCWGANDAGQLGGGIAGASDHQPHSIPLDADPVAVGCGVAHACAITVDDRVQCWGANDDRQVSELSAAVMDPTTIEVRVVGARVPLQPVRSVVAGGGHTCATVVDAATDLWCWGRRAEGQTFTAAGVEPTNVLAGIGPAVSAGVRHTCAWTAGDGVLCSGVTGAGAPLGTPPTTSVTPGALTAGTDFGCVLLSGTVVCWGVDNVEGQLSGPAAALTQVVPLSQPIAVSARAHTACAILNGGSLACWGNNQHGQVGPAALGDPVRTPHFVVFTP